MINIFVLLTIILIIVFIIRTIKNPLSIPTRYKKYLVIAYCTILTISTLILYFIPKNIFLSANKPNGEIINMSNLENFKNLLSQGKLNTSDAFTQKRTWSFEYNERMLKISDSSNLFTLVAERKNVDDGKIDVINYVADSSYNGINITDKINVASARLTRNTLMLYDASNSEIKINQFNYDLTISQFIKDGPYYNNTGISQFLRMRIMYIKIPKSLQIDDTSKTIEMIN